MSFSALSFILWAAFILVIICSFILKTRHSKQVDREAEDVASQALPQIGGIAQQKYEERFGRAPTNAPEAWYPDSKKKTAKVNG